MKFYLLSHIHTQTNHNILLISYVVFIRVFPSCIKKDHALVMFSVAVSWLLYVCSCSVVFVFCGGGGM